LSYDHVYLFEPPHLCIVNFDKVSKMVKKMSNPLKKVFVYTEVQISVPFTEQVWKGINERYHKEVPGLVRKTWLSGLGTQTVGGFYEFDSLENAQNFAWNVFPQEPRGFGVSFTTKLFDGDVTADASIDMKSPHYLS
jgi:hypothetical protein